MNMLCRKNELGKLLNFMQQKYQEEFDFFPRTWVLPRDLRAFEAYVAESKRKRDPYLNPSRRLALQLQSQNFDPKKQRQAQHDHDEKIFIVKPEAACQGKGIFLVKDVKDIEQNYNTGSCSDNTQSQNTAYK